MKFYLASALENIENVKNLITELRKRGHDVTYNWTTHGPVYKPQNTAGQNVKVMRETAEKELDGIYWADGLILVLPGGRGTHTEFGYALAMHKPVLIYGEPEQLTGEHEHYPCAFYYHPLVMQVWEERNIWLWIQMIEQQKATRPRPPPMPTPGGFK